MIGIILAGGLSSRLGGGDKGRHMVGGLAILDRVIATLRAQCDALVISANGDAERFAPYGLPVVPDNVEGHLGPLAGILAGLDWIAAHRPESDVAVTAPTDTPFLPMDLVDRLASCRGDAALVCARSGGRTHGVASLWPVRLRHELRRAVTDDGLRKVGAFLQRYPVAYAEWSDVPFDPFFNVNTAEDLGTANAIAARFL